MNYFMSRPPSPIKREDLNRIKETLERDDGFFSLIAFVDSIGVGIAVGGAFQLSFATSIKGRSDPATLHAMYSAADTMCIAAAIFTLSLISCLFLQFGTRSTRVAPIIARFPRFGHVLFLLLGLAYLPCAIGFALVGWGLRPVNPTISWIILIGVVAVWFVLIVVRNLSLVFIRAPPIINDQEESKLSEKGHAVRGQPNTGDPTELE